jgi:hypothetical protein
VKKKEERLRLQRVPQPLKQSKTGVVRVSWWSIAQALGSKRSEWHQRLTEICGGEVGPGLRGEEPPRTCSSNRARAVSMPVG